MVKQTNLNISDGSALAKEGLDVDDSERPWQIDDVELPLLVLQLGFIWFLFYGDFLHGKAQLEAGFSREKRKKGLVRKKKRGRVLGLEFQRVGQWFEEREFV